MREIPRVEDVLAAQERISPYVVRTPLVRSSALGLWLKLESLQVTGSFKPRGAFNHLLRKWDRSARGVVTASSGNHGQAVAYAARALGLRAVVVVPEDVVGAKEAAIQRLGAQVVRCGRTTADRIARAQELASEQGLHYVPPFDDPDVIAGQGTVGLEILQEFADVQEVCVPCGGGGLTSGVALVLKARRPQARVVAVEPEGAACFFASWRAGRRVRLGRVDTVADGLRAVEPGELTWECARRYVDEFATVTEEEIRQATVRLALEGKVVAEPSGAVAVAYALRGESARTVAVVSGEAGP